MESSLDREEVIYDSRDSHADSVQGWALQGTCHSQENQRGQRLKVIIVCKTPTFHLRNVTTLRNLLCFPFSEEQRPVVNILLSMCVGEGWGRMGVGALGLIKQTHTAQMLASAKSADLSKSLSIFTSHYMTFDSTNFW